MNKQNVVNYFLSGETGCDHEVIIQKIPDFKSGLIFDFLEKYGDEDAKELTKKYNKYTQLWRRSQVLDKLHRIFDHSVFVEVDKENNHIQFMIREFHSPAYRHVLKFLENHPKYEGFTLSIRNFNTESEEVMSMSSTSISSYKIEKDNLDILKHFLIHQGKNEFAESLI